MAKNRVGSLRRSQVVGTYGPGAIVDFRVPGVGAPVSGVLAGLEEWDRAAGARKGMFHPQTINEPRLQKRLYVQGFRLPPVKIDESRKNKKASAIDETDLDVLPVVRFPEWLQCPRCDRIDLDRRWSFNAGGAERWCSPCSADGDKVWVIPVRFIVACESGHLDEFPWQAWIGCRCNPPVLHFTMNGPGLAGKLIECRKDGCTGTRRSMEGAFARDALSQRGMRCRGRSPWLATAPETCPSDARVLQRGASNVYWADTRSALDIPPFSTDLSSVFGPHWEDIKSLPREDWPTSIRVNRLEQKTGLPPEVLLTKLEEWKSALDGENEDDPIELAEYRQFHRDEDVAEGEFQTRRQTAPPELSPYLDRVVLAERLREVRASVGFTRILPPGGPFRGNVRQTGRLSIQQLPWLPGVELRGEGIFLGLNDGALQEWEGRAAVIERAERLRARVADDLRPEEEMPDCSPRFLLLHSFAHALMRQLSLECGYSSSALRERLYAGLAPSAMAGVLIHTGSPDSEGTLGGLVRQGRPAALVVTIQAALDAMSWCSSDPLCITTTLTLSSPRNASACHSCLLAPETSCQHFNNLLDRAMLVGTPDSPEIGFFQPLLGNFS